MPRKYKEVTTDAKVSLSQTKSNCKYVQDGFNKFLLLFMKKIRIRLLNYYSELRQTFVWNEPDLLKKNSLTRL